MVQMGEVVDVVSDEKFDVYILREEPRTFRLVNDERYPISDVSVYTEGFIGDDGQEASWSEGWEGIGCKRSSVFQTPDDPFFDEPVHFKVYYSVRRPFPRGQSEFTG